MKINLHFIKGGFKLAIIFVILCSSCVSYAFQKQIRGNGNVIEEKRDAGYFNAIKAAEGIEVFISSGSKEEILVEADENVAPYIVTEIRDNQLKVYVEDNYQLKHCTKKVHVTYTELNALKASSGGQIKGRDILHTDNLEMSASSGGILKLELEATDLECGASSGGIMDLKGKAGDVEISASSGGILNASDLSGKSCEADASSGGILKIGKFVSLEADASSGGIINYRGVPQNKDISKSSGGIVSGD